MNNKTIKIIWSQELLNLKLKGLIGYTGVVVAKGEGRGYWVKLDKSFLEEEEWFIPTESLQLIN